MRYWLILALFIICILLHSSWSSTYLTSISSSPLYLFFSTYRYPRFLCPYLYPSLSKSLYVSPHICILDCFVHICTPSCLSLAVEGEPAHPPGSVLFPFCCVKTMKGKQQQCLLSESCLLVCLSDKSFSPCLYPSSCQCLHDTDLRSFACVSIPVRLSVCLLTVCYLHFCMRLSVGPRSLLC